MFANEEFDRLQLLFRRSSALPSLPTTAFKLLQLIDSGEATAGDLERVISCDPSLAATFLRVTSAGDFAGQSGSSIRMTVLRIGQRAVRSIALSLVVKDVVSRSDPSLGFDGERYARHSIAVGMLARYIFARQCRLGKPIESSWSADEIFAAGVLHDLAFPLLAQVSPESFARVHWMATKRQVSLSQGFQGVYGKYPGQLGAVAARAWNLPEIFAVTMENLQTPWTYRQEASAISCLAYAESLASQLGCSLEGWRYEDTHLPDPDLVVPEEEYRVLQDILNEHVSQYMAA